MLAIVLGGMVFGLGAAAVVTALVNARRARQGTLLWLLAVALERGLPLADEVDALAEACTGRWRERLRALARWLHSGIPLAEAIERTPGLVPHSAIVSMKVGSECARLDTAVRDAAVRYVARQQHRRFSALSTAGVYFYLWGLLTVGTSIVAFVMYFIIPKFKKIFDDFGTELPATTEQLIRVSDAVVSYGGPFLLPLWCLPGVAFCYVAVGYWKGWDEADLPGPLTRLTRFDTVVILRNLTHAVAANRPLVDGLDLIRRSWRQPRVQERLGRVVSNCQAGIDCWAALRQQGFLTSSEVGLLEAAQRVGNLEWTLCELANSIQSRRRYRWQVFCEVVQPLSVLLLGLIAGFVVIGLFLPLIELVDRLSKEVVP